MLKKAMIMAAGVGSRLGALSDVVPKPLVPLVNKPAMDIIVEHLASFGIKDIIANTYYKAEDMAFHYRYNQNICLVKEEQLSGTAGGVKKCQSFFSKDDDFIVMSGDGLSDVDIKNAYESHKKSGAIATIVLQSVEEEKIPMYGIVVTDSNGIVESFQEKPKIEEAKSNLANTGIYIFRYDIFDFIPENTFYDFAKNVFPEILNSNEKINTYVHSGYWSDIGSIEQYKKSHIDLINHEIKNYEPVIVNTIDGKYNRTENLIKNSGVIIQGNCSFGENCVIGKNVKIINSILWGDVTVEDGITIENSIVLNGIIVENNLKDTVKTLDKTELSV